MDKIIVIIPAHNEEKDIGTTLKNIIEQPFPADKIIVILDNCTDSTLIEVQKYHGVKYFETKENTGKKAGALNQGIGYMIDTIGEPDYILQMDADTFIDKGMIEAGVYELKNNFLLGGVCNRFRVKGYSGGSKLLYSLQALDYSFNDSNLVEKNLTTNVLSGTATLFRWNALKEIEKINGNIWNENSSVEDYRLTLDLRKNGWRVKAGREMFAKTDYMPTLKLLWQQRKRWSYGTIEELVVDGWAKHNKKDILSLLFSITITSFAIFFMSLLTILLITGNIDSWSPLGLILMITVFIDRIIRTKYIRDKTLYQMIIAFTIIPGLIYAFFLIICYYYSAYLVFSEKPLTKW